MRILLVEDETALADVIARNLRARSHDVVTAATAEAALLSMAERWPEVVVLDINLPDHSGWEILRRLSKTDRERLDVVAISAAPISQKRIQEFQPLTWLQKPFPMEALLRAISNGPMAAPIAAQEEDA